MTEAPAPSIDQPTYQPPRHPFPELRRSATDRMLGGVAGGLAEYSGIDALLWRIGFVALVLMGPGLVVYPLLWVLMKPAVGVRPEDLNPADRMVTQLHERLSSTPPTAAR
jgi:phage shock protein C